MDSPDYLEADKTKTKEHLSNIIRGLNLASRIGNDKDDPEGSRYILISDTLANEIVIKLKNIMNLIS